VPDLPVLDHAAILRAVRTWPRDEQWALAGEILRQTGIPMVAEPLVPPPYAGFTGLLVTDQASPTDDEVARWRDARRQERYGS